MSMLQRVYLFLKNNVRLILIVFATVIFSIVIASVPNAALIEFLGTENIFLFMYLIAFIGSISTFASVPYPLILIGLVGAGSDPLYTGLASAAGVVTADAITFFTVKKNGHLLGEKIQKSVLYLGELVQKYPKLITPGLFAYGTVSPLSNDFAVITFSLMKYSYFRVALPLAAGNILYNLGLAFLGNAISLSKFFSVFY